MGSKHYSISIIDNMDTQHFQMAKILGLAIVGIVVVLALFHIVLNCGFFKYKFPSDQAFRTVFTYDDLITYNINEYAFKILYPRYYTESYADTTKSGYIKVSKQDNQSSSYRWRNISFHEEDNQIDYFISISLFKYLKEDNVTYQDILEYYCSKNFDTDEANTACAIENITYKNLDGHKYGLYVKTQLMGSPKGEELHAQNKFLLVQNETENAVFYYVISNKLTDYDNLNRWISNVFLMQ